MADPKDDDALRGCSVRLLKLYTELREAQSERDTMAYVGDKEKVESLDAQISFTRSLIAEEDEAIARLRGKARPNATRVEDWSDKGTVTNVVEGWHEDSVVGKLLRETGDLYPDLKVWDEDEASKFEDTGTDG